jgi:O-antigen ligase
MYVSLLALIFVLPYSLALIEMCQVLMMASWACKKLLVCQPSSKKDSCFPGIAFLKGSMGWALLAIGLLIVLTIPFSHYPALSLKKFFSRFLQQIFLMYLVTQIINSRKRLYTALSVLLMTFCFVLVDVMAQHIWGRSLVHHTALIFGRVSGPMNHPNDLGTLLVTVLPVILTLIITCRTWIPLLFGSCGSSGKWMIWAGKAGISVLFLLLVEALGLTASRGAWIAFVVSIIVLGFNLKRYKSLAFIVLILVLFSWVFSMHFLSTRIDMYNVQLPRGYDLSPSLTNPLGLPSGYNAFQLIFGPSGREFYWGTAVDVIRHFPWFGCGYSAYTQTLRDLHVGHEEYPHNSLLHITAELGLVGLMLYLWFFTALWLNIKNVLRKVSCESDLFLIGCGVSSGILAWMIHSLMDTPWTSLQLSTLWWLLIGVVLSLGLIKGEKTCP